MGLNWSNAPRNVTVNVSPAVGHADVPEKAHARQQTGFPIPTGESRSYWLQNAGADPLLDHRTTDELPSEADVVIIGSGMSGTLVAHELLHSPSPPKRIVLLEARDFCSGATGRNAGHCKPDQYRGFTRYSKKYGPDAAFELLKDEQKNFLRMSEWAKREDVDCDLWVGDTLDVAVTREEADAFKASYESMKAHGGDDSVSHVEYIDDPHEAAQVSRINGALVCVRWKAGSFYPWKFAAHVTRRSLDAGLNLQTWTPVDSVTTARELGLWSVNTQRGSVSTLTVIYATNAYTPAIHPVFRGAIIPRPFICTKVVPPRSHRGSNALQHTYRVAGYKGSNVSINPRSSSDGVILFGGESTEQPALKRYIEDHPGCEADDSLGNFTPITEGVEDFVANVLTGWEDSPAVGVGQVDYNWSGIIGDSADGLPFVGPIPDYPGQWILAGFSGHGMARIFTSSAGLVKLIRGFSWEDTGLPGPFHLTRQRLEYARSPGSHKRRSDACH